jgi:hypothetical protein
MQIGPHLESVLEGITLSEEPSATNSAMVSSNSQLEIFSVLDILKPQIHPVGRVVCGAGRPPGPPARSIRLIDLHARLIDLHARLIDLYARLIRVKRALTDRPW